MKIIAILGLLFTTYVLSSAQSISELKVRADSGDVKAMLTLAEKYDIGIGAPHKPDSAKYFMDKAANSGDPNGQFLVGLRYIANIYSAADYSKGIKWLKKAAEQNHTAALLKLREVYADRGADQGITTESSKYYSKQKAFEYSLKAAELGDAEGALQAGRCYFDGTGVTKDRVKAAEWLRFAAFEKDFPHAKLELADLLLEGYSDFPPDPVTAAQLYAECKEHPKAGTKVKALAEVGIHESDRVLKRVHNQMLDACPLLVPDIYRYPLAWD